MSNCKAGLLGLDLIGINDDIDVYRNLTVDLLVEDIISNGEGQLASSGATMVDTGKYTGRSPQDKYIVDEKSSKENIWWGSVNQKISEDIFNELYHEVISYYNKSKSKN